MIDFEERFLFGLWLAILLGMLAATGFYLDVRRFWRASRKQGGKDVSESLTALQAAVPKQVAMGWLWFVICSVTAGHTWDRSFSMACWLPLNYLLFDLYLLARGGRSEFVWHQASLWVKGFAEASPMLMMFSAVIMGSLGTRLYEEFIQS